MFELKLLNDHLVCYSFWLMIHTMYFLTPLLAVAGKSIMEHNEILGMDAALKYINQTLVDKIGDITLQVSLEVRRL